MRPNVILPRLPITTRVLLQTRSQIVYHEGMIEEKARDYASGVASRLCPALQMLY